jgi:hypothetical protein
MNEQIDHELRHVINQIWNALYNISGVPKPWPNLTLHLSYWLWDELSKAKYDPGGAMPIDRTNQLMFGTHVALHEWDQDRVELSIRVPLEQR